MMVNSCRPVANVTTFALAAVLELFINKTCFASALDARQDAGKLAKLDSDSTAVEPKGQSTKANKLTKPEALSTPSEKNSSALPEVNDQELDADSDVQDSQETWDSYSDLGKHTGVAQDVTRGVRVEDIVEPPSDYRYAAFGKADPFVPPLLAEETTSEPTALEIPLISPLQRYELDSLSVVGIWQLKSGERKAMIMTPAADGAGVIVKNGDLIGKRGGKILGIGDDYLNVREFSLAADGSRRFEDRQMLMGKRNDQDLSAKIRFKPGQKQTELIIERGTGIEPHNADDTVVGADGLIHIGKDAPTAPKAKPPQAISPTASQVQSPTITEPASPR